jgi:DNA invertase Pin-like site-specific DNA recombinase
MSDESREAKKKRYEQDADKDLVFYEQEPEFIQTDWENKALRVAVYCRVSTDNENQATSFSLQKKYYEEFVAQHKNWTLVDIYADEGLSATSYTKRTDFKRMLVDCKAEKIDLIITKNVARFSRNVVDCLGIARDLLRAKHSVGIYFQEQNLNTLTNGNEMILTMMSSIAQAESQNKRDAMLWSYEKRFGRGQFMTPTNNLLGYFTDSDGYMQIDEEGAKTVRAIFKAFLAGYSLNKIAYLLSFHQRPTAKGNIFWSSSSVRGILINEKMCGDVVAQKTFTIDVVSHKAVKNVGQKRSVYKRDHHPAIVSRREYVQALLLLKSKRGSVYFNPDYMVRVIRKGLLMGFIPVNPAFGGYSPTHYMGAYEAADVVMPPISGEIVDVKNATVARIQEFAHSAIASVTLSDKQIKFNSDCIGFFEDSAFVELLFHPAEWILAVRRTTKDNSNAILWNTKPLSAGNLCKTIYTFCGWNQKISYKVMADCFTRENEGLLMFDLGSAEFFMKEEIENLSYDENGEQVSVWKEVSKLLQPEKWQEDFGRDVVSHATTCRRWLARSLDDWLLDAPSENVPGFDNYESVLSDKEIYCQHDSVLSEDFGEYLESKNNITSEEN